MFEEMTFELIMAQMMSEMPEGISTSEGSLLYNACAKQAARLEEAYQQLYYLNRNMYTDTADLEHLIADGYERGVYIKNATSAEFKAQFNCHLPLGTELTYGDFNYTVITCLDEESNTYLIVCNEAGAEPNNIFCELEPVEYIEEFEWGKITELITAGKDMESEEAYRVRLMAAYGTQAFAGNRAYYEYHITLMDGVGGIKMKRRTVDSDSIDITIIGADYNVPSEELIKKVQENVDPTEGEGDGLAPIGHKVRIAPVNSVTCDITTTITYDEGFTYEDLATQIEGAVESYLLELRKQWKKTDVIVVRILQIESHIASIAGIIDVSNTTINGADKNLNTGEAIPVKGVVSCS